MNKKRTNQDDNSKHFQMLGWQEWCALPKLQLPLIKAKIDTGAKTSCLHAFNIKPFRHRGEDWLKFMVHPLQANNKVIVHCKAPLVDRRFVTSSNGQREKRYVISTTLQLGTTSLVTEITLSDRSRMNMRLLLGRNSLQKCYIHPFREMCLGKYSQSHVLAQYKPFIK